MAMIQLNDSDFSWTYEIKNIETGDTLLIQSDTEYPGVASVFGWTPCTECAAMDGTVDCQHKSASEMIADAQAYLDDNIGEQVEDPGYFE